MLSDRDRLAQNLKVAREARGISQDAAAEEVGKSRGTIANWEKLGGEFEPRSAEVAILAELYGLSTQDLRYALLERGVTVRIADGGALDRVAVETEQPAKPAGRKAAKKPVKKRKPA